MLAYSIRGQGMSSKETIAPVVSYLTSHLQNRHQQRPKNNTKSKYDSIPNISSSDGMCVAIQAIVGLSDTIA
jgi:hypothetical protein